MPPVGILEHSVTGAQQPVAARLLIGRSPACALRLTVPEASSEHAKLSWTAAERWALRDLGSKNGTFVDGRRVEPGVEVPLDKGARLAFGDALDVWTLVDDGPPGLIAWSLDGGEPVQERHGLLALPDEVDPLVTLYRNGAGAWVAEEIGGEVRQLAEHSEVAAAGRRWRIHLPIEDEGTPLATASMTLDDVDLRLAVSRDEERVQVTILHRGREIPLEPREHGYVLLTMARHRRAEHAEPIAARGWLQRDRLLKMLAMDTNAFNVAVHRARRQLLAAGVEGAAAIVEVRRTERRFGTDRFEIVPLD